MKEVKNITTHRGIIVELMDGQQVSVNKAVYAEPVVGRVFINDNVLTFKFINWKGEVSIINEKEFCEGTVTAI